MKLFINLNREFEELDPKKDYTKQSDDQWGGLFGRPNHNDWTEIHKNEKINVILGEAGSGKSAEFKDQAKQLAQNDNFSFYIPLEDLINSHSKNILSTDLEQNFERWLSTRDIAYFFLDSVDESKFSSKRDFDKSIDNFIRLIGAQNKERCKIYISSRYSEWNPVTDISTIQNLKNKKINSRKTLDRDEGDNIVEENESELEPVKVYKLIPLNHIKINLLSNHYLKEESGKFLTDIDQSNAWSLIRRPLDLIEIAEYWKSSGRLDTLKEILEFKVSKNLEESPERKNSSKVEQISPKQLLDGAKILAASTFLIKKLKFYFSTQNIEVKEDAINPKDCLYQNWTDRQIQFFLGRSIFDQATYNTVKFHHRTITEYLAAEWFRDRLDSDHDYSSIRKVFFHIENENIILKESLKPVVAWLAIGNKPWNKRIQNDILESFPELFFKYGDPNSLTVDYRIEILKKVAAKYRFTQRIYVDDEREALSRFGHNELVKTFKQILNDAEVSDELKYVIMRIAFLSKTFGLSNEALLLIQSESTHNDLRIVALWYMGECGNEEDIRQTIMLLLTNEAVNERIIGNAIDSFHPKYLSNEELVLFLKKVKRSGQYSIGIDYYLQKHLAEWSPQAEVSLLIELSEMLNDMLKEKPYVDAWVFSERNYWVGKGLFEITKVICKKNDHDWEVVANSIFYLNQLKHSTLLTGEIDFNKIHEIHSNQNLRREYFWISSKYKKEADPLSLFEIFGDGHMGISKPKIEDINWLIADASKSELRNESIYYIKKYWDYFGRPLSLLPKLRKASKSNTEIKSIFSFSFKYRVKKISKSILWKLGIYSFEHWRRSLSFKFRRFKEKSNSIFFLYKNIYSIYSGQNHNTLYYIVGEMERASDSFSKIHPDSLTKKYGLPIKHATIRGLKRSWHDYTPGLPKIGSSRIEIRLISGSAGIVLSLKSGELSFKEISFNKAKQLTLYAIHELNGFSYWLKELTKFQSEAVKSVFESCIDKEWEIDQSDELIIPVISKIGHEGNYLIRLIENYLLMKLENQPPKNFYVLKDTLALLILNSENHNKLINCCEKHVNKNSEESIARIYFGVLLQLDARVAINKLENYLRVFEDDNKRSEFIMRLCVTLHNRSYREYPTLEEKDYLKPEIFIDWFSIVYKYVNPEQDTHREGVYSSGNRDFAQEYRGSILEMFLKKYPQESVKVLESLTQDDGFRYYHDYLNHRKAQIEQLISENESWLPSEIQKFVENHESDPKSVHDLFNMVLKRLNNIKDEVERDQYGINIGLRTGDDESELRKFIRKQLEDKAGNKFIITQEEEINPQKEPDIRVHRNPLNPISFEIKWAQRWSFNELVAGLEKQLVGDYLRAPDCNYGIYLVGYIKEEGKNEKWRHPEDRNKVSFDELIAYLQNFADSLKSKNAEIDGLVVIGINFNKR